MNADTVLQKKDEEILVLTEQLRIAYRLKRTLRYNGTRDFSVHNESVAEHIFALLYLAQFFLPLEDEDEKLDREKVYEMILFHDFGEILNGDIPYHMKTKVDLLREQDDAEAVFDMLPELIAKHGKVRWEEYEHQNTLESKFVFALDKVEPLFELLDPVNGTSMKRLKFTYQMHIEKKLRATEEFPVMRRFLDAITPEMESRDLFWKSE